MRRGFGSALLVAAAVISGLGSGAWPGPAVALDGSDTRSAVSTTAGSPVAETQRIAFEPDPTPGIPNPERGLNSVVSSFQTIDQHAIDNASQNGFTLIRTYVDLAEYTDQSSLPAQLLEQVDSAFSLLRSNGMKAILRFSYSPGGVGECSSPPGSAQPDLPSDAPLDIILGHIDQVAGVVASNEDVISSIEAGFLGEFGEWHCSTFNRVDQGDLKSPLTPQSMAEVVQRELDAFPPSLQIAVRYPRDIAFLQSITSVADSNRIGNHQDCYASNQWDSDTWDQPVATMDAEKTAISALGVGHVVAGVACAGGPGTRVTCGTDAPSPGLEPGNPEEMASMHFSYLAGEFNKTALDLWRAGGCWDEIVAGLGYRLRLISVDLPTSVEPGGRSVIDINLRNDGWAAPFAERPLYLTLTDTEGEVTPVLLDADPRGWASGADIAISTEVAFPAGLAPGSYTPGLWLPDASPVIQADPRYAIRFANLGTWDPVTGINALHSTITIGAQAGPPTPSSPGPDVPGPRETSSALAETGTDGTLLLGLLAGGLALALGGTSVAAISRRRCRSRSSRA
ncbi:DUF4832 domain-containing protein [Herbiconiux sp. YIM B11900]|uniref:DUF4832 domain-containing protein n=1 Tax=Herbiconiux sp. YIM B11900 TaxID=3404131 RepID=UPI003F857705